MKRNYIIYARISPRPLPGESIKEQIDAAEAEAKSKNGQVRDIKTDSLVTGTRADKWKSGPRKGMPVRPGLDSALLACKEYKATLIVRDISRLSRNMPDACRIVAELKKWDCGLVTLDGLRVDTDDPIQELMFHFMAAMAHYQAQVISKITSDTMNFYQNEQGRLMGGRPPFGKMIDPIHSNWDEKRKRNFSLLIDCPEEQKLIRRMVLMRTDGKSDACIAEAMMHGQITFRGKPRWHARTIDRILKREEKRCS